MRSGFGVHKMDHFVLPKLRLVFHNKHAQSTSLGPKLCFWVVLRDSVAGRYLVRLGLGCIQCTTLCYRSCVLFFRSEHAQSTCLGPKLSLWVVSRDSVAGRQVVRSGFGVHKMHYFVLPKLRLVFSQQTCPIHFFRPKTKFLGGFARFRCRGGTRCEIGFWGA